MKNWIRKPTAEEKKPEPQIDEESLRKLIFAIEEAKRDLQAVIREARKTEAALRNQSDELRRLLHELKNPPKSFGRKW